MIAVIAESEVACEYSIDTYHGLIYVDMLELATVDALRRAAERVRSDPRFAPWFDVFVDCRHLSRVPSSDLVYDLASSWKRLPAQVTLGRLAVLVDSLYGYAMSRMFEVLTGAPPDRVRSFQTEAEAVDWLQSTRNVAVG